MMVAAANPETKRSSSICFHMDHKSRPRRLSATSQKSKTLPTCKDDDSNDSDYVDNEEDSGPSVDVDLPCKVCGGIGAWDLMLLCSKCNNGYHTFCVDLDKVPEGDWYCSSCLDKGKFPARLPQRRPLSNPFSTPQLKMSGQKIQMTVPAKKSHQLPKTSMKISQCYKFLKTGKIDTGHLGPGASANEVKNEAKRIRKRARNYKWHQLEGKLYKTATGKWPSDRLVISPGPQRRQLIEELHTELGHLGTRKVCSMLQTRYYWRNMVADDTVTAQDM